MNDMSPADDEFLSSYLDGDATPQGIARIESDPTLLARVEELRAARDLIASPVTPLSTPEVDALIGAALDASATTPVVTGIERARQRRSDQVRTMVAVAAGVLLLAIAVPVLSSIGDSDSSSSDTASVALDDAADDGFSLEAMPTDDASAGSDDTTDDDMAAADSPDDTDTADEAFGDADGDGAPIDQTETNLGEGGLYALEPVLDQEELGRAVENRLREYDTPTASFMAGALEDLGELACAEEFAFLAAADELTVVDSGVTAVGATATAVVLVSDADGDYLLFTTPLETCTPISILELGA